MNNKLPILFSLTWLAATFNSTAQKVAVSPHSKLQINGPVSQLQNTLKDLSETPKLSVNHKFAINPDLLKTQINPPPAPPPSPCLGNKTTFKQLHKINSANSKTQQIAKLEITGSSVQVNALASQALRSLKCSECDMTIGPVPPPPPAPNCMITSN